MGALFTVGYEGTDIDRFIETLLAAGVTHLVDVRAVPISRKKGFSKSRLAERLAAEGLDYTHLVDLGDPKPGREAARAGRYLEFQRIYRAHLSTGPAADALGALTNIMSKGTVALLCFERDPKTCHRSLVAEAVVSEVCQRVVNLYADDPLRYRRNQGQLSRVPSQGEPCVA